MKYVIWFLVVVLSLAAGSAVALFLITQIGFSNAALACITGYGTLIIGVLLILGLFITRNYVEECRTHRTVVQRLHDLGLPTI